MGGAGVRRIARGAVTIGPRQPRALARRTAVLNTMEFLRERGLDRPQACIIEKAIFDGA